MFVKKSNLFLVPYNDNRSLEDRIDDDCASAGIDQQKLNINLVGTYLALSKKQAITANEIKFIVNSNRPLTRLLQRCFTSRTSIVKFDD